MRIALLFFAVVLICSFALAQSTAAKEHTLTIAVQNMDSAEGNLGILIFNGPKGWAEDRQAALKDISIPAQKGVQKVPVQLPPGKYAVALIHDLNVNHKLDKNFIGMPKEYWGMSNNPHATIKAPAIEKAMFELNGDKEVEITLQK